jgi:arsenite methyltransferase
MGGGITMSLGVNKPVEDMNYFELLAWLGIGSSHPGGFPATEKNLAELQVGSDEYVLDAGCGSGLTACHLAKNVGCKIMAVDLSPQMIEKARERAKREGVAHLVEFKVADVYNLPFSSNRFDLVMGESITVFLDKVKVYKEFLRVLKPGGRVADLEMALLYELPDNLREQMEQCFGVGTNPLPFEEWLNALRQAGFEAAEIKNPQPLKNNSNSIVKELKKDWVLIKDLAEKVSAQPGLLARLQKNAGFIKKNTGYFGFGLVYAIKPEVRKVSFRGWLKQVFPIRRRAR